MTAPLKAERAAKYNVPRSTRAQSSASTHTAGRPALVHGTSQVLFGNMRRLSEFTVLNIKNKSHSVTADIRVPTAVPRA